jgi:hypothetical protein
MRSNSNTRSQCGFTQTGVGTFDGSRFLLCRFTPVRDPLAPAPLPKSTEFVTTDPDPNRFVDGEVALAVIRLP